MSGSPSRDRQAGARQAASVRTEPAPARIRRPPTLELGLNPGRVDVLFDAEIVDLGDRLHLAMTPRPHDLAVASHRTGSLTGAGTSRSAPAAVRSSVPRRGGGRSHRAGYPPPMTRSRSGTSAACRPPGLTSWAWKPSRATSSSSNSRVEATGARPELVTRSRSNRGHAGTEAPTVPTYRVDDPAALARCSGPAPPRVNVLIESQMTIHPDSAEWVAALRYDVAGGAPRFHPRQAPHGMGLEILDPAPGREPHRRFDPPVPGPVTLWTLKPDHPIWGSQRLVMRSTLPLVPGQEMSVPDITPLGLGFADTYVGLVFAAGSIPATAGSSGLHRIPHASRFQDPEFSRPPGTEARAFRVDRKNWTPESPDPARPRRRRRGGRIRQGGFRGPRHHRLARSVAAGQGRLRDPARTGRFLVADLPPAVTALWATVDQNPVSPLRSAEGRWLVPLGDQGPYRVSLFWSEPAQAAHRRAGGMVPDSSPGRRRAGAHPPDGPPARRADDQAVAAALELSTPDRIALERADRISRRSPSSSPRWTAAPAGTGSASRRS